MFKGAVQRLGTQVTAELPNAVASLDRMVAALEAYLTLTAAGGTGEWNPPPPPLDEDIASSAEGASMARAEPVDEEKEREETSAAEDPPEAQGHQP